MYLYHFNRYRPSGVAHDRICRAQTVCTANQFEFAAPWVDPATGQTVADRVCEAVTTCTSGQYQSVAPTATSNRVCRDITVCGDGLVESVAPNATRDRECVPAPTDDPALEGSSSSDGSDPAVGAIIGVIIALIVIVLIILLVQHNRSKSAMITADPALSDDVTPIGAVDGTKPTNFWSHEEVDVEVSPIGQEFIKRTPAKHVYDDEDSASEASSDVGSSYDLTKGQQSSLMPRVAQNSAYMPVTSSSEPVLIQTGTFPAYTVPSAIPGGAAYPSAQNVYATPQPAPVQMASRMPMVVNAVLPHSVQSDDEEDTKL